ncbi:MFS transporter [Streptomyces tuirus]|uniref:MFS transporter n=1 Tax=Streptomyces tuirus TaxID=68278 RepID=A0A941F9G7_9ACTN|nr:MFS transporter [Streptomyces tuirus]
MQSPTPTSTGTTAVLPRSSIVVAALSTVVEWYDFTLYLYMATVLSRVFFGPGASSLLETLAVFAIAYLMRPIGAMVFGHIGDRIGRRTVMLGSMGVMTAAMLATALLPTAAQTGSAAGALLLLLRCVMGFAVGGEYTGVTAYLVEGAAPRRRGLIASLASAASQIGTLLAAAVPALTVTLVPASAMDTWGWRIPFLFGALLAGAVLIARSSMPESPAFEQYQHSPARPKGARPLIATLGTHRTAVYRTFAISALGSVTYYVGISYVPTYLGSVGGFSEADALWLSTIAIVAIIVITPLAGALSDRIGRRPALLLFGALSVVLPLAMFGLMTQGSFAAALTGSIVLACVAGGISAVTCSAIAEQFPVAQRLSGLALGATAATAIFGGLTPYAAQALIDSTGWALVPGAMVAVIALAVAPVLRSLPETAPDARPLRPTDHAPQPQPR